jgi:hypothetical protein
MITWPPQTLANLNATGSDTRDLVKQMEKINKVREEKKTAEEPVVKYNRTVAALEKTLKQLLVMMADPGADEALLTRLAGEENQQSLAYEDTLAIIKTESPNMDQPRAKRFYDRLIALAHSVGVKKTYYNYADPSYSITANSGWRSQQGYFAVSALTVVNVLATAAKEPAVKIPDVKAYEEGRRPRG